MSTRDQIIQQALALPPEDRVYVADALEQSLTVGDFSTPEIAAAWAAEIEQRLAAYESSGVPASDLDEAFGRVHERLSEHRRRTVTS